MVFKYKKIFTHIHHFQHKIKHISITIDDDYDRENKSNNSENETVGYKEGKRIRSKNLKIR